MAHIYGIVVTDTRELGFDRMAEEVSTLLPGFDSGLRVEFLTNPLVPANEPDDFEVVVLQHGAVLDSLNAEDEPYTENENLEHLVNVTTRILAEVRSRVGLHPDLDAALDRWDEWADNVTDPELESEEQ